MRESSKHEGFTISINTTHIVVSSRVELRALTAKDAAKLFWQTDNNRDYLGRYLPWVHNTKTEADSQQYIEECSAASTKGEKYAFGIFVDGELAGHASLFHLADDHMPEIGYWISESVSGRGYATQAAAALTELARSLGVAAVCIQAVPENIASNAIAQKLGYTQRGTRKDAAGHIVNNWVMSFRA